MSEVICHVLRLPPFMAASKTAEIQWYDFRISNLEIITLRVQNAADVLSLSKSAMFQKGKIPRRQYLFLQAGFAALFKISGKCSSSLAACGRDALAGICAPLLPSQTRAAAPFFSPAQNSSLAFHQKYAIL
ncbi:MAG: hypothetical protein OSJ58_04865 [Dysosmobacter sp.]|nr:hypothetical protein [Dysosmobacter sp.]